MPVDGRLSSPEARSRQSSKILRLAAESVILFGSLGCDSVRPVVSDGLGV